MVSHSHLCIEKRKQLIESRYTAVSQIESIASETKTERNPSSLLSTSYRFN